MTHQIGNIKQLTVSIGGLPPIVIKPGTLLPVSLETTSQLAKEIDRLKSANAKLREAIKESLCYTMANKPCEILEQALKDSER